MTDAPAMTSHRPYLLRALYEWIADNGLTPHILVDATKPGVRVPAHAVKDGRIVLNIAARAVGHLQMDNDDVRFSARFGGVSHAVIVPIDAVLAIYAGLGWPWKALSLLRFIPRALRDPVYRWLARNRYRLFGRRDACWIPAPEDADRVL